MNGYLFSRLSAVRKVPETITFQALGIIETLGSIISLGTSWIAEIIHWIISPNVRTHLRKVFKKTLSSIKRLRPPSQPFTHFLPALS